MNEVIQMILDLIGPQGAATVLLVLGALSAALPLLEWVAERTANKWDNRAVAMLRGFLEGIPRVRLGGK